MKWLLVVMGVLAALFALMALIGAFVAREHHATSTITLRQPPESVWKVVRDIGGAPAWFSAPQKIERPPDRDGDEGRGPKGGGVDVPAILAGSTPPRTIW